MIDLEFNESNENLREMMSRGFIEADEFTDLEGNPRYRLTLRGVAALDQSNLDSLMDNLTGGNN
jgi:hypothetical protein